MPANPKVYDSERMAYAYAFTRPPIHAQVCKRIGERLPPDFEIRAALDVGCGAGASTAALASIAGRVVGLDPISAMLRHAAVVAPTAEFAVGSAEAMPFGAMAFDLITAAGSLNYTDVKLSLAEISRVLSVGGIFAPYDFSAGRSVSGDESLAERFAAFRLQFPSPTGYALDLQTLPYAEHGLALFGYEEFDLEVAMSSAAYIQYILGDCSVEAAIAEGRPESEVRTYCERQFGPVFAGGAREVGFHAQLAVARKTSIGRDRHDA